MVDKVSRAVRRHHRARMYKKIANRMKRVWRISVEGDRNSRSSSWYMSKEEFHRMASRHRDNAAMCSCHGCGNPRRHYGNRPNNALTMQERKALEHYLVDPIGNMSEGSLVQNSLETDNDHIYC